MLHDYFAAPQRQIVLPQRQPDSIQDLMLLMSRWSWEKDDYNGKE